MLNLFRDVRELIAQANAIKAEGGEGPGWSLFLTNRSFIALALAVAINAAAVLGAPIPSVLADIGAEAIAGHIVEVATVALALWALVERLIGKTDVIWNRKQASKAVEEAEATSDPLAKALAKAGAIK